MGRGRFSSSLAGMIGRQLAPGCLRWDPEGQDPSLPLYIMRSLVEKAGSVQQRQQLSPSQMDPRRVQVCNREYRLRTLARSWKASEARWWTTAVVFHRTWGATEGS